MNRSVLKIFAYPPFKLNAFYPGDEIGLHLTDQFNVCYLIDFRARRSHFLCYLSRQLFLLASKANICRPESSILPARWRTGLPTLPTSLGQFNVGLSQAKLLYVEIAHIM